MFSIAYGPLKRQNVLNPILLIVALLTIAATLQALAQQSIVETVRGGTSSGGEDPLAGTVLPLPIRTITVSNTSEQSSAINSAMPGDHIVLTDGSYDGLSISCSGTAANPIVIRAANIGQVTITGSYEMRGDRVYLFGLVSSSVLNIWSSNFRVWRCYFQDRGDYAARLHGGSGGEFAYCTWKRIQGRGVLTGDHIDGVFRYCGFFDSRASNNDNDGEAVHHSFGEPNEYGGWLFHRCKFRNWSQSGEEELISCKNSNNIFRQITIDNCPSQALNIRQGQSNVCDAVWTKGSLGIGVHDGCLARGRNIIKGCKVESIVGGNGGIMVRSGQFKWCQNINTGPNMASQGTVVTGCDGRVAVGRSYSNWQVAADRTRIREHTGEISIQNATNTDSQPGVAEDVSEWANWSSLIWLEDSDVGPLADI